MPNPLARFARRGIARHLLIVCAVIAAFALAWRFTPLSDVAHPRVLVDYIEEISDDRWAPLYFLAAYIFGGFVLFPVTVLGGAVAIIFPPLKAIAISFTGVMVSSALHHWIGARFLRKYANSKRIGRIRKRIDELLTDQSIVTIAALRMVPIAPFALVNLVAGCMGIGFRDYMFGTALGLAPSITMVVLFGQRVRAFWHDPTVTGIVLIVVVAGVWIGLAIGLQKWVSRWRLSSPGARARSAPRRSIRT